MSGNSTLLTLFGVALLATVIIGMLISQSRHRALEARNNQLRMLTLQQRRLQNLIRTLPISYLSNELRDFLYQALLQNLNAQLGIGDAKNTLLKDDIERITAEREAVKQNPPQASQERHSADETSIYRGLLKTVHQFITRNYETGRLKKEHAENMILQVEQKLVETAFNFFVTSGDDARQTKNYRQARNAYQKALDAIEKSTHADEFKQESMKIRANLNHVIDEWRSSREINSQEAAEKLSDQMSEFVEDQDSWKKKQTYE